MSQVKSGNTTGSLQRNMGHVWVSEFNSMFSNISTISPRNTNDDLHTLCPSGESNLELLEWPTNALTTTLPHSPSRRHNDHWVDVKCGLAECHWFACLIIYEPLWCCLSISDFSVEQSSDTLAANNTLSLALLSVRIPNWLWSRYVEGQHYTWISQKWWGLQPAFFPWPAVIQPTHCPKQRCTQLTYHCWL